MGFVTPTNRGFTLIELLLVLVVVTVMLSLAASVLPDRNESRLANEAARLIKVLDTLQMEAMLQRTRAGLVLDETGYQAALLNLHTLEWEASELRILAPRQLQLDGLELQLLAQEPEPESEEAGNTPAVVFDSTGVSDPFRLQLAYNGMKRMVATIGSDGLHGAQLQ